MFIRWQQNIAQHADVAGVSDANGRLQVQTGFIPGELKRVRVQRLHGVKVSLHLRRYTQATVERTSI